MKKHILYVLFFCWATALVAQQKFFVDGSAQGQNTGQDWQNAYVDLHQALNQAQKGDEIWVAQGVYKPHFSDRSVSFEQASGVRLYGGFAGTETSISERNLTLSKTILEGDIGISGDSTDNSFTLLYQAFPDTTTILDGFTIQNGLANDGTALFLSPRRSGAGVFIEGADSSAYGRIQNCIFLKNNANFAGGAVLVNGEGLASVAPQFFDCQFYQNSAGGSGGAIMVYGSSIIERGVDMKGCIFDGNSIGNGLGMAVFLDFKYGTDSIEIEDCTFVRNFGFGSSGNAGVFSFSEAVDTSKVISMLNCRIIENFFLAPPVALHGLGISSQNGFSYPIRKLKLENCELKDNLTQQHSLLNILITSFFEIPTSTIEIINSTIADGNIDIEISDLLYNNKSNFIVTNSELNYINVVILAVNLVSIKSSTLNFKKLTFYSAGFDSTFIENSVIKNYGNFLMNPLRTKGLSSNNLFIGSQFRQGEIPKSNYGTKFNNCISVNNTAWVGFTPFLSDIHLSNDSTIYENCLFYDSTRLASHTNSITFAGGNIFGLDPMFLDTANQDYHLHPCSPLINAGTNTPIIDLAIDTDLDGNPRILDGTVDIGPYESNHVLGQLSPPDITAACYGLAEGKVTLAAEGGCPPYALAWTRSDDGSMGSDTTGLLAGNYLFTVTDARGRQLEVPLQIGGSTPQVAIVGDSLACAFTPNAFLQANATNATQPIDFQWNTGQNTGSINNLGAGLYSVEITDGFGCKDSASVEVTATPPVNASIQIVNATGANKSDGALNFSVSSGYPPYSYAWSNGATADSISNLLPGDYTVTVIDGNNCGYVFTYTVSFMVDTEIPTLPDATNTVWPNPLPAGAPLNLRFSTADLWHLMDAQGRVLFSVERTFSPFTSRTDAEAIGTGYLQTMQIELPCLASGTYFWSFSRAGRSVSAGKLVL